MNNSNTIKYCSADLRIESKFMTIKEISNIIELTPTTSYNIGDIFNKNGNFREESIWLLSSNISQEQPLEDHINKLLFIAIEKKYNLKKLSSKCDIEIFCSFSSFNGQGSFVLNTLLMKKLVDLKINLVVDLYLLNEET